MNVTVCSAFRNAERYLPRYFVQMHRLHDVIQRKGVNLALLLGEGDSTDNTRSVLETLARSESQIIDCTHGGPPFDSIVHEQRFRQLAHVGNAVWSQIPLTADVVMWVEADLIWEPWTLTRLMEWIEFHPVIAPMVYLKRQGYAHDTFYDTWAYRGLNERPFSTHPPYVEGYRAHRTVEVSSVGSCFAMRADLARRVSFPESTVVCGMCAQLRALGASIWIDPESEVFHE